MFVEAVAVGVLRGALERAARAVDGGDVGGLAGEVECKRAVVAEAVERAPACIFRDPNARFALIEKRSRFLSCPWGGDVADAVLVHLDLVRHVADKERCFAREAFARSHRWVVARENAVGPGERRECRYDVVAMLLDARTEQLHDKPTVVAVAHERWHRVTFGVNEAERIGVCVERLAPLDRACDTTVPPLGVDDRVGVGVEEAE